MAKQSNKPQGKPTNNPGNSAPKVKGQVPTMRTPPPPPPKKKS
jgi:hypothetical protein